MLKKYFTLNYLILLIILAAAAVLRFHKLTMQSMAYDELQTMLDAGPGLTRDQFFNSIRYAEGVHPPLFFIFEKYFVLVFGYNEWAGRALAALAGVGSVWAIFLLGKEIKNERLGLIAAAISCVNYFSIYYSQEARMYSFVLLFTTLSYLFFIRLCKYLKTSDAVLLVIFSVFLIYTHYFGFLVIVSQLILALFFLAQERRKRKRLLLLLFTSELIIAITYIPWLSHLIAGSEIRGSWIEPLKKGIFIDIFKEYFGYSAKLCYAALCFTGIYMIAVLREVRGFKDIKLNSVILGFIFVFVSLIISIGIPYWRSVTVVPMIVPRYTIIVLPSIIIGMAFGLESIPNNIIRIFLLSAFLLFSVYHLVLINKYYRIVIKPQFRELTAYLSLSDKNYAIVNPPGTMDFYLGKYNFRGPVFREKKVDDVIDSILQKSKHGHDVDTFWMVGFYNNPLLTLKKQKDLDTAYAMIKDTVFFGAWAELYARSKNNAMTIDYTYFNKEQPHNHGELVTGIWSNDPVTTKPVSLLKGTYKITVQSEGTPVNGVYPHNNLFVNGDKIGGFYSGEDYRDHTFYYDLQRDTMATIKINMDNDTSAGKEDRNAFVRKIYLLKTGN